jgi:ribosome-binding protein aMBF1 (putative translation factor)
MIRNERQYRITKSWISKFKDALFELNKLPESIEQPWLRKAQRESAEILVEDLYAQLKEYDALKSGKTKLAPLDIINNVSDLLVKWRIARNWTQKQLAEKLGLAEQQIQKYEERDYACATLETIKKVAAALKESKAPVRRHKEPRLRSSRKTVR